MNDISDDGHRVGRVIDSIRAMFGQQSTERPLLDLNELLCHTLSLLRREMESQNIDLELDLDKSLPSFAANRVQLQQALLNLFVNAVDAMNSIADRPRLLTVKSRLHDLHGILITIADSRCRD